LPTFVAGAVVTATVLVTARQSPLPILKDVSWSVLPLVAGLFRSRRGVEPKPVCWPALARILHAMATTSPDITSWTVGIRCRHRL